MIKSILVLLIVSVLTACSGMKTFNDYSRAGDTISIAVGWKQSFKKNNITVTITPSIGSPIIIPANDPAIRAVVNMYPDPVSSLIVSREINANLTPNALLYGDITNAITNSDKDWYQTIVLLDLPVTLPTGIALIEIMTDRGDTASSTVEIIAGTGSAHSFTADSTTSINANMFNGLSRTTNYAVSFDSAVIPHAIEINFSHNADVNNGGVGKAFAINPLGYKKSIIWNDDGYNMKVMLFPTSNMIIDHINDYKFYVAGKIENLVVDSVNAYDVDGNVVSGVNASIALND